MQSPDHPELAFVQAKYYSKGRPDGPPLWIVVHDMEAGESSTRAESTAEYFRTMPDGRTVSSHYTVDNDSVVQCVLLRDVAWTVGNRPGNYRGINWELSGFARQTRDEWLDPFGIAMFARMAPIVRADAARFGIPLRRCSIEDLLQRRPGITSHNDLRLAFGGTTHTDPGPNFPWDVFLQIITEYGGTDMFCERGDKSLAVGALQLDLRGLGYYSGGIDRIYGPATSAALLAARKAAGSGATSGDTYDHWAYDNVQDLLRAKAAKAAADRAKGELLEQVTALIAEIPTGQLPAKLSISGTVDVAPAG